MVSNIKYNLFNRICDYRSEKYKWDQIEDILGIHKEALRSIYRRGIAKENAQYKGEDLVDVFNDEMTSLESSKIKTMQDYKEEVNHRYTEEQDKQMMSFVNNNKTLLSSMQKDAMIVLVSDLQIGKLVGKYNTQLAKQRVIEYTKYILDSIILNTPKRVVVAMLGDIIESSKKHPNSRDACDSHTNEQFIDAVDALSKMLVDIKALCEKLGIELSAIGIAGNHDWDGHGMEQFKPGKLMLAYPLYTMISRLSGVKIDLPEGTCSLQNIAGIKFAFEHGVGVASNETAMSKRKNSITEFFKEFVDVYVMGDKHNVNLFNNCKYVVNGAFFGSTDQDKFGTEYSSILGFNSKPSQCILYVKNKNVTADIYYFV